MSDSLSSFNDVETDPQSVTDQFVSLRDNVLQCVEQLDESGFSVGLSDDIGKALLSVKAALEFVECSQLYIDELINAKEYIESHPDHRNVEVLRHCLQQLSQYISNLADHKQEHTTFLVSGFNEIAALRGKPLISAALLSLPDAYRVSFTTLKQFQQQNNQAADIQVVEGDNNSAKNIFSADESYLEFSQLVLSIYRGQNRSEKLQQLGAYFEHLARHVGDVKASAFWLACGAYVQTVSVSSGELRPAVFVVFEQIEKVVMSVLAADHKPVLGIQGSVDRLLCDLLSALYCAEYQGECLPELDAEFEFASMLQVLESQRELQQENELHSSGIWLRCSARELHQSLQSCIEQLGDEELLQSEAALKDYLQKLRALKLLLMLAGVHSARENLEEVEQYLQGSVAATSISSSVTSLQLVEQQMLYQFNFLAEETGQNQAPERSAASGSVITDSASTKASSVQALPLTKPSAELSTSADQADFGTQCNLCIDVIQQSLDTALGSSGNLMPDNSVISALTQLVEIVEGHGVDGLADLLNPLAVFLASAANTTLNQSETLLVQEAVIAATLGIDSLIGDKPMPELVMDVSGRIEKALSGNEIRTAQDHEHSEAFDNFLNEAEELLPRLFELFQRWRGAPFGSNRLHTDISRHLHSLKGRAEEVDETALATVVHYLEATMLDLRHNEGPPSQVFFDLAIESVEWLGDDINRLRNNERSIDAAADGGATDVRNDLVDRLKLASASDCNDFIPVDLSAVAKPVQAGSVAQVTTDSTHNESSGLVLVDDQPSSTDAKDHSVVDVAKYFRLADNSFNAVSRNQDQLLQLTKELNEAVADAGGSNTHKLRSLAVALADIAQSQSSATKQLGLRLGSASQVELESIRDPLVKMLTHAAEENSCRVRFKFESNGILLHRDLVAGIQRALAPLLCSVVAEAFESREERVLNGKPALPTIEVSFIQLKSALLIQVADDGFGVTVHGAEAQSNNPWKQTSKVSWAQFERPRGVERPTAWANFEDAPIDISVLIDFAAHHGATVAVSGDELGSVYQLTLPQLVAVRDVVVVEVQQQKIALLASQVMQVSRWSDEKAMSLASLIGIKRKSAFGAWQFQLHHLVRCKTATGEHALLVDNVVGHQSLEFSSADRLIPDVPGYLGAAVSGVEGVVVLLDLDHWVGQQ